MRLLATLFLLMPLLAQAQAPTPPVRVAPGVDFRACLPEIPAKAKRAEATGQVVISFMVELDGRITEAKIKKSSGPSPAHAALDEAAMKAVSACTGRPGSVDGKPERMRSEVSYAFNYGERPFSEGPVKSTQPMSPERRTVSACPAEILVKWHDCVGSNTLPSGERFVGEYRNDRRHGDGIEYRSDGTVGRSGLWEKGELKSPYALDTNRFPFNSSATVAQPQPDAAQLERERLLAEVDAERQKRLQDEQRLAERDPRAAPPVRQEAAIRSAHALVIGNGAYAGSARLDNPVNDATAVSDKLRSMGFTVTTVTNAPRARMLQALSQFQRSAAGSDVSLLYFAGHGVQIDGANFILPTDIDHSDVGKAIFDGVRLSDAIDNFLPGKTKLVFLDACRDNPLQRTAGRSLTRGLAPMNVAQGTLIAYATRDGQVALDGVGQRHSPFTKALLEHLADPSDISVVLRRVREKVMQATAGKQQPWDYGSLTGGELVLSQIRRDGRP